MSTSDNLSPLQFRKVNYEYDRSIDPKKDHLHNTSYSEFVKKKRAAANGSSKKN